MIRPVYERPENALSERQVVAFIENKYAYHSIKMPQYSGVDYLFYRDGLAKFFIEIKERFNPKAQYPTYMISLEKINNAKTITKIAKVNCYLVVMWSCGSIGRINLEKEPAYIEEGGRVDRGDSADIETCAFFKMSDFMTIQEK